jgi:hypothetical protein
MSQPQTIDDLFVEKPPVLVEFEMDEDEDKPILEVDDELDEIIAQEERRRKESRPVKPFDVRFPLTDTQWEKVEEYYINAVKSIALPEDPTSKDIMRLNAEIDMLYTEARFDQGFLAAKLDQVKRQLSDARKTVYEEIKNLARNDKERDALGTQWLEENPHPEYGVSIMVVYDAITRRKEFMDAVVSILKSKADKLIVDSAAMKLEASV